MQEVEFLDLQDTGLSIELESSLCYSLSYLKFGLIG
jgi:hypothetical protein